jgi:hypothetical protein
MRTGRFIGNEYPYIDSGLPTWKGGLGQIADPVPDSGFVEVFFSQTPI